MYQKIEYYNGSEDIHSLCLASTSASRGRRFGGSLPYLLGHWSLLENVMQYSGHDDD